VLALRRRLRSVLWHGRPRDPATAEVTGDDVLHGVFTPRHGGAGEVAVVLCHFEDGPRTARVALPGGPRDVTVHRPFAEPVPAALPAELEVPAGEYVVVAGVG
jgi:hypothetical protein